MRRLLMALTIGLFGLVAGAANAQTFAPGTVTDATGGSVYSVTITPTVTQSGGFYTYSYAAQLQYVNFADNVYVNTFSFGGLSGLDSGSESESGSGFTGFIPPTETGNSVTFSADPGSGLHNVGATATFSFDSILPPGGTINLTPSASTTPPGLGAGRGSVFVGPGAAGGSQSNPVLPSSTSTANGQTTFQFSQVASGIWVDPPTASAFQYAMTVVGLFTGISGFPTGFAQPFDVSAGGKDYGTFMPGQALTFSGGGVSSFLLSGITTAVDSTKATAFPLKLTFSTGTASFTRPSGVEAP